VMEALIDLRCSARPRCGGESADQGLFGRFLDLEYFRKAAEVGAESSAEPPLERVLSGAA
jgi:hypothetical protein